MAARIEMSSIGGARVRRRNEAEAADDDQLDPACRQSPADRLDVISFICLPLAAVLSSLTGSIIFLLGLG